jgi:hypothetical protein
MQRDEALEDLEAQQQQRAGELSMITAKEAADERNGVWDGQSGELVEPGMSPDQEQYLRGRAQLVEDTDVVIEPEDSMVHSPLGVTNTDGPALGPNGIPLAEERQHVADEAVIDLMDQMAEPEPVDDDPELTSALAIIAEREARMGAPGSLLQQLIGGRAPMTEEVPPARTPQRVQPVERSVVVRLNATVEPTIGQGPNSRWNFQKGKRYRVPAWVAEHLEEKHLVSSWG